MKPTALTTKCLYAARRVARSGKAGALARAHTPARRPLAPPRFEMEPGAPAELRVRVPLPFDMCGARVLHIDTESGTATVLASLLGSDVHVTNVATLADARQLLQDQIFSLVILDPALPDGDASQLLALLAGTPLLVYADQQPLWRDAPIFLSKSWTTSRQLWTAMSSLLWNTSALSAGD